MSYYAGSCIPWCTPYHVSFCKLLHPLYHVNLGKLPPWKTYSYGKGENCLQGRYSVFDKFKMFMIEIYCYI